MTSRMPACAAGGLLPVVALDGRTIGKGCTVPVFANLAAAYDVAVASPDFGHREPMICAARDELTAIAIDEAPDVVLADGGYWNVPQIEAVMSRGS